MDELERFAFVMVRPKSADNMGAAARALKNMGFGDLRFVAPPRRAAARSSAMAVHARDVLAAAQTYGGIDAAVADRTVIVGTTARTGLYRSDARPLHEVARELLVLSVTNRIAILFGPEDFGLSNDDLKWCHRLITIPASPAYTSLNVAQAVLLVAYELRLAALSDELVTPAEELAAAVEVEAMFERMTAALLAMGFLPEDNPDHLMLALRAMLGRSGVRPRELDVLNGIARQIRWVAEGGSETLADKRRAGKRLR